MQHDALKPSFGVWTRSSLWASPCHWGVLISTSRVDSALGELFSTQQRQPGRKWLNWGIRVIQQQLLKELSRFYWS